MKKFFILIINLVIIFIVLCSYTTSKKVVSNPKSNVTSDDTEYISVNVTYEDILGDSVLSEVQTAISKMPPDVIRTFSDENWKIAIVSEIDLSGTQFEGDTTPLTVGLTDYTSKTIQVAPVKGSTDNFVMVKTLHELCHFADQFYNNATDSAQWRNLYAKYKTTYIEYEYSGVTKTDKNRYDIEYATSDRFELFACSMKDFFNNPTYLRKNFPEIYAYFAGLVG